MDPLSISIGVVGILEVVAKSLFLSRDYIQRAVGSQRLIGLMIIELEALQTSLSSLDEFLRSDAVKSKKLTFERSSVVRSMTSACDYKVRTLASKLEVVKSSRLARLSWPLNEKEHQKALQELRDLTRWTQLALSVDGCALLAQTSEDVLQVMSQQLEGFKIQQDLNEKAQWIQDEVTAQSRLLQEATATQKRSQLLSQISSIDQGKKHRLIQSERVSNTGDWVFDQPEYTKWRHSSLPSLLWCHGIGGSGKTFLSSLIIDQLSDELIAYFYFDYRNESSVADFLSTLLKQIVTALSQIPKEVIDSFEKNKSTLAVDELERLIISAAADHRLYLVVDALDECEDNGRRRDLIAILKRLSSKIRVITTSRRHLQDIEIGFQQYPQLAIYAHESDLRKYIHGQLAQSDVLIDEQFETLVVERLTSRAQGMFLLPVLQLQSVLSEPTIGEMEDALLDISTSLAEAFEASIARIKRLSPSRQELGIKALMWTCHAKRQLTIRELSEALSIRPNHKNLSLRHCPPAEMIVECCQGLVLLDREAMVIRIAHFAIQGFLIERSELHPGSQKSMAMTCMQYLMFEPFRSGPLYDSHSLESHLSKYQFLAYAGEFWGAHVRGSEGEEEVHHITLRLLAAPSAALAYQVREYAWGHRDLYWHPKTSLSYSSLHHASHFSLHSLVCSLLTQGLDINCRTEIGSTPIIEAIDESTVQFLLQRGADPSLSNWYGYALHCAAEAGASGIIRRLVAHGVDINDVSPQSRTPLECTLDNDHSEAFETLIELGASLYLEETPDFEARSILHEAVQCHSVSIITAIIRCKFVDINTRDAVGQTPLHYAAACDDATTTHKLLEAGADPNARNEDNVTPLGLARECEHIVIEHILLQWGDRGSEESSRITLSVPLVEIGHSTLSR